MNEMRGNLLDVPAGIICHQVNCKRVAGAGLALQIRTRWPLWYADYMKTSPRLGQTTLCVVQDGVFVANLYSQKGYGPGLQTDYVALRQCLRVVSLLGASAIYVPYNLGCGLAGGDWNIVKVILEQTVPNATIVRMG